MIMDDSLLSIFENDEHYQLKSDNTNKSFISSKSSLLAIDKTVLPPEREQGNVEYKLKLINPSPNRLEHLITQMKWRLEEGMEKI